MTFAPPRASQDPTCTHKATFADLIVGDRIDYWGPARPVVGYASLTYDRVRITVANEAGGRDVALAPGSEAVWRAPRQGEPPVITCPRCKTPGAHEIGAPVFGTDDFVDCARCAPCGLTWALDPGADIRCTECGGSGHTGRGSIYDPPCTACGDKD